MTRVSREKKSYMEIRHQISRSTPWTLILETLLYNHFLTKLLKREEMSKKG
jgi:hypothetical protein